MLATLGAIASQGGPWFSNPTLKINFENGWIDQVRGTAWTPYDGNVYLSTNKKFGTYSMFANEATDYGASFANIPELHVGANDFTMACWLQVQNDIPTSARSIMGVPNEFVVQAEASGLVLYVYLDGSPWVYGTPNVLLPSYNNWHFVKAGRKGTKLFINVNGVQASTTIPANTVIRNVGANMALGNIYTNIGRWIDSFVFVNGVGDDSLEVPTLPF